MASEQKGRRQIPRFAAVTAVGLAIGAWPLLAQDQPSGTETETETEAAPTARQAPRAAEAAGGPTYTPAPGWAVNLGLTVSQTFTDNGRGFGGGTGTTTGRRAEFITEVAPTLNIAGNTPRVQVNFGYTPSFRYYAVDDRQSNISHSMNGRARVTVVEDLFFIDAFAYAALVPRFGALGVGFPVGPPVPGQPPGSNLGFSRDQLSQVFSFGVTPYVVQRFGGWGTGKLGISFQQTSSSGTTGGLFGAPVPTPAPTPGGFQQFNPAGVTRTIQETAEFATGEELGRYKNLTRLSAAQIDGTGATRNSKSYVAQNVLSYAATRWLTVFGQVGYQKFDFPAAVTIGTAQPFRLSEVTYGAGVKMIPNADSQITISYIRQFGLDTVNVDAFYAITARTTASLRIWTGLGTNLQQLQNDILTTGLDQYGYNVALDTGAPVFLGAGFLPGTQNVFRSNNLSASLTTNWTRNSFSLGVSASDQRVLATAVVTNPNDPAGSRFGSGRSIGINAGFTHQFSELMSGAIFGTYGARFSSNAAAGTDHFLSSSASLSYIFSPTLTGAARYTFYDLISQTPGRSYIQNVFILSLSKQF